MIKRLGLRRFGWRISPGSDERIEANIDGLRIAETSGWSAGCDELDAGGAGGFFVAGVLAVESDDPDRFDKLIARAYASAEKVASEPYHPADDPWRGLVSALAWVERGHAARAIDWLLDSPRPRTRWLGVAACGARRLVSQPNLEAALADHEPLVRARAARTMGQLGRADSREAQRPARRSGRGLPFLVRLVRLTPRHDRGRGCARRICPLTRPAVRPRTRSSAAMPPLDALIIFCGRSRATPLCAAR